MVLKNNLPCTDTLRDSRPPKYREIEALFVRSHSGGIQSDLHEGGLSSNSPSFSPLLFAYSKEYILYFQQH